MEAKSEFTARKDNFSESMKQKLALREELNAKYQELLENKNKGIRRLMKAFPDMKSKNENEALNRLKNYLREKEEKKKEV